MVYFMTLIGAFALLPSYSSILSYITRSTLVEDEKIVRPQAHCRLFRYANVLLFLASIVCMSGLIFNVCQVCPTANQHVLAASIITSLLASQLGTNVVRAIFYSWWQPRCLTPSSVRQLLKDVKALNIA